ncbi:MAG: rhodanese-like domain-containing protein [Desulfobulbaceae bacterium]|nr:rhodanese-like domain-containing protein [Desulfobulbaceae bacterium]
MITNLFKKGQGIAVVIIATALLLTPPGLMAAQIKGKIQSISKKARTIQLLDVKSKKVECIQFGEDTRFINAKSIKEFIVNDVVLVDYEPGQTAASIKRIMVELPPEKIIKTAEIAKLLRGPPTGYMLIDARPEKAYNKGHLPTAVNIFTPQMKGKMALLPKDKNRLLVFYCGGPT